MSESFQLEIYHSYYTVNTLWPIYKLL